MAGGLGRGQGGGGEIIGSFLITKVEQHTLGDNADCAGSEYQSDHSLWLPLITPHVTVSLFLLEEEMIVRPFSTFFSIAILY